MPLDASALAVAYRLAEPSFVPVLAARLREETRELLEGEEPLPRQLGRALLASGDRDLLLCLARGVPRPRTGRPQILLRLARDCDPQLAVRIYQEVWANEPTATILRDVHRALFANAAARPEDPGWRAPDGLVPALLAEGQHKRLTQALRAPFPDVVRHALATLLPDVDLHDQYAACQAVLTHGGRERLAELVTLPGFHPDVVRAAGDPARLAAWRELPTDWLIALLRRQGDWHSTHPDGSRAALPVWDEVLAAHRAHPLPGGALRMLWKRRGCPAELVLAGYEHAGRRMPADMENALPWEVLTSERWRAADDPGKVPNVLNQGVRKGWFPVRRVLAEVGSAHSVLGLLPQTPDVQEALASLVAPLGADVGAWRALLKLLVHFSGSCDELVAAAVAQAPDHRESTWWRRGGDTFLRLVAAASEEAQLVLLPLLRHQDVRRLFCTHEVFDGTRDRIVAVLGENLTDLAREAATTDSLRDYLFRRDSPQINAILFERWRLSSPMYRALLAGRPQQGGILRLPLEESVVKYLGVRVDKEVHRRNLLHALASGDPRLARLVLGGTPLHTPGAQLTLLVNLWERHGPEEVRVLLAHVDFPGRGSKRHPLPVAMRTLVNAALDAPDTRAGLQTLRRRLEEELSPAGKVAFLRSSGARSYQRAVSSIARLLEETAPEPLPWDELATAHRADPLPEPLLGALGESEDCPAELLRDARSAWLRTHLPGYAPTAAAPGPGILDLLRQHGIADRPTEWLTRAVEYGGLAPQDVLREIRPAALALDHLTTRPPHRRWLPVLDEARRLTAKHLGANADAWAMALVLLPDFEGTLPELLSTVEAVVG